MYCSLIRGAQSSRGSRDLRIKRQDSRLRTDRSDREGVDLPVTLGVVVLNVSELCCAAEGLVVPVQVANPSVACQSRNCEVISSVNLLV